jgi:hypothetical protein
MKKIMLLGVVIATTLVACKKESTSPNTTTSPTETNEKIRTVIISDSDSSNDTINYSYDDNGKLIKIIFISNGQKEEQVLDWKGDVLVYDSTTVKLNTDKLCIQDDLFNYEYKNGYLTRYGIKSGTKIEDVTIEKDTFLTCVWQNENLISDGFYRYEYYEDKLNNNFFSIYPFFTYSTSSDQNNPFQFMVSLQDFHFGGNFTTTIFGKSSKHLVKKISDNSNEIVYEVTYTFDSKNKITSILLNGIGDNKDSIKINYIWK